MTADSVATLATARAPGGGLRRRPRVAWPAGPCAGIPREPEAIIPALIVPLFFFVVNVGVAAGLRRAPASAVRLQGVPAPGGHHLRRHRHQPGQHPRHRHPGRLLRPPPAHADPAPALLLGLMIADFVLVIALSVPVARARLRRSACASRPASSASSPSSLAGAVGPGVHRLPVRHRAEDREPGGGRTPASSCSSRSPSSPPRSCPRTR